jgi:hypothetical protein
MFCAASARPVRAAVQRTSISSDEGVECGSASASVRRARSRRGTFVDAAGLLLRDAVFGFDAFDFLRGPFCAAFFPAGFFLADDRVFTVRFAVGRLAERRAGAAFRADLVDFTRFGALRLAITRPFGTLTVCR